jgi:phosphoglycolate phosphatase-like HAD superfamily hydrolase
MIKNMKSKYKAINLKKSFFIGDTIRDVLTAKDAGCRSMLVLSGKEKLRNRSSWEHQPHLVFKDLLEAAKFIAKAK